MVAIGCCHTRARENGMKDSEQNILETGEFTLNMMSEWFLESANHTCGSYDRGVDELRLSSLTPIPSVKVSWLQCYVASAVLPHKSGVGCTTGT